MSIPKHECWWVWEQSQHGSSTTDPTVGALDKSSSQVIHALKTCDICPSPNIFFALRPSAVVVLIIIVAYSKNFLTNVIRISYITGRVGCKIKMQGLLLKNYKKVPDLNSIILNQRWDPLGIGPCAAILLASLWSWLWIQLYTLPDSLVGKESTCNAGEPGSIPGSGRPTGEGKGYPL